MSTWLLAFVTSTLGIAPLLIRRRFAQAIPFWVIGFFLLEAIYYAAFPSMVWPFLGIAGFLVAVLWTISAIVDWVMEERPTYIAWLPALAVGIYIVTGVSSCNAFRSSDYAALIGQVERREWTQDVQPKDPRHVRLVPLELAYYLATKQLGEAPGAIGSQFHVIKEQMTLQLIKGELWYVAPLDYRGFSVWTSAPCAPGYVMVHGEDPKRQVIVKTDQKYLFTLGAFWGNNLERHLWYKYPTKGLTDYSFEIDEEGKAWWAVTVFRPAITWFGRVVEGVIIVDPETGDDTFYPMEKVPDWVDRAVPEATVKDWIDFWGELRNGWVNSWWDLKDVTEPEEPSISYGSDGQPYWVTAVTSKGKSTQSSLSMVGLFYTNSRTGKSVYYHATGGTDRAITDLVNNKVSYRKLHGDSPVLYNIYGTMTSIVPLLGESHSFQGIAMADVANMQVAVGDTIEEALHQYQKTLATGGQTVSPEKQHNTRQVEGVVDRFRPETSGSETLYYLHVEGIPHIFIGSGEMSAKLRLTKEGDRVVIKYVVSDDTTLPLMGFDNLSFQVGQSANEADIKARTAERQEATAAQKDTRDAREEIKKMSDKELQELLRLKEQKK